MAAEQLPYLAFHLRIDKHGEEYCAYVNSPVGQAESNFTLPFAEHELRTFSWIPGNVYRQLQFGPNPVLDAQSVTPRTFGARLYEAVFTQPLERILLQCCDRAEENNTGVRIYLRIASSAQELAELPWEYLYSPAIRRFLALSIYSPLVRYLEFGQPEAALTATLPLRILTIVASPAGLPPVDGDEEWAALQNAVADLKSGQLLSLARLERATVRSLRRYLRSNTVHILHFVGHGGYNPSAETGYLAFEDEAGECDEVSADALSPILRDHRSLRLVFLNACEAARAGYSNAFSGFAQELVHQGMPAVVAMQFPISVDAAVNLADEFYHSLAQGKPVDAAVTEARQALHTERSLEWGTPVLFMRSASGELYDFGQIAPEPAAALTPVLDRFRFQQPEQSVYYVERQAVVDDVAGRLQSPDSARIIGLVGMGGAGKTSLATRIAHALQPFFPDGILWATLAPLNANPDSSPAGIEAARKQEVETILLKFARAFGQQDALGRQPDLESKTEFLRSILANKRVLIVIDNVEDKRQLDLLLPGGRNHRVLITTSSEGILHAVGAVSIPVGSFSEVEAIDFLRRKVSAERIDAELVAAKGICRAVGYLPLALSVVTGHLTNITDLGVAEYEYELRQQLTELRRMPGRSDDENRIWAALELGYQSLDAQQRLVFASLALFDGPDFGCEAVAAMHEIARPFDAMLIIGELCARSLVLRGAGEQSNSLPILFDRRVLKGRFRLHPIAKVYAWQKLGGDALRLQRRLVVHYAALVEANCAPQTFSILDQEWPNISGMLQWLEQQRDWSHYTRCVLGLTHYYLGQLGFLDARGQWSRARELLVTAYDVIDRIADPLARAQVLTNLGGIAVRRAKFAHADRDLQAALMLVEKLGDSSIVLLQRLAIYDFLARTCAKDESSKALEWLARGIRESSTSQDDAVTWQRGYLHIQEAAIYARIGLPSRAIAAADAGLALLPQQPSAARINGLMHLGVAHQSISPAHESIEYLKQALALAEQLGDVGRIAMIRTNMAWDETRLEQYEEAIASQSAALEIYRYMGDVYYECGVTINLGATYRRIGAVDQAEEQIRSALQLAKAYGFDDLEAMACSNLADTFINTSRYAEAAELLAQLRVKCQEPDYAYLASTVARQQAEVALNTGNIEEGIELATRAIHQARESQDQDEQGIAWRVLGTLHHARHDVQQAQAAWTKSFELLSASPYELGKTKQVIADAQRLT